LLESHVANSVASAMSSLSKVAKAGLQSATIMSVADAATQISVEGKKITKCDHTSSMIPSSSSRHTQQQKQAYENYYDPMRTLRWATVGLTLHGPFFLASFAMIDRYMGAATTLQVVMKKTALAQFIVFPPYLVGLFTCMGLMEASDDIVTKVSERVPEAFVCGCAFWPGANTVNFAFVPAAMRVPYLAAVGGLWNGFLSWLNARDG